MKYLLIAAFLFIATVANAQSPFKSQNVLAAPSVPKTDSIINAWRFSIPVSPAGITFAGIYQAAAGLAYGFQKQNYNFATQVYTVKWSASFVWIPIQTGVPINSIKDIATFGALFGIKNNIINLGPFYNINAPGKFKDKAGLWLTTTINLNN